MNKESPYNIVTKCREHAPKPDKQFAEKSPEFFIDHFVKKAFTDPGIEGAEHMWVKVKRVVDGELEGRLDNDPVQVTNVKCGDIVRVRLDEIEEFLPGR